MRIILCFFIITGLISCSPNEEGFLPQIEKDEPYYPNKSLEQLWSVNYDQEDNESIIGGIKFIRDYVILYYTDHSIKAFRQDNGELVWETSLDDQLSPIELKNYKVKMMGNAIHIIGLNPKNAYIFRLSGRRYFNDFEINGSIMIIEMMTSNFYAHFWASGIEVFRGLTLLISNCITSEY